MCCSNRNMKPLFHILALKKEGIFKNVLNGILLIFVLLNIVFFEAFSLK